MATVLPKAERGLELSVTRVSVEPPHELPVPSSGRAYGPGDMIDGKYELESLLGKGGMGEVWTARNTTLDVRRAVKLIRADTGSAESTDRLLCEAQAAARLADPAIVRVFDFGKTSSGDPYIVMEMLEGEDLMSVIRRRERLSPVKAVRVLLPMLRALAAAHAHGIIHRDLKPENIFLAKLPDGRVQPKLLDFGIAKLKNAASLRLTTAGAVLGSPLYMAPEQARGEDVDERADIWALCVVLYEVITGNPPFSGDDRAMVLRAVADASPPRLSQHGVADDSLWPIIARGLEKQRQDRWASMEELGRALARWLLDAGVTDDITGASLEAGWFRSARQSLFGSSTPPRRAAPSVQEQPSLAPQAMGGLAAGLARLSRLARLPSWSQRLGSLSRSRRWGILATLGVSAALSLAWLLAGEPEGGAASSARESLASGAAQTPSAAAPPSVPREWEPSPAQSAAAIAPAPPAAGAAAAGEPAPSRSPARALRRTPRSEESAPKDRSKEQRRSKLIDPYR